MKTDENAPGETEAASPDKHTDSRMPAEQLHEYDGVNKKAQAHRKVCNTVNMPQIRKAGSSGFSCFYKCIIRSYSHSSMTLPLTSAGFANRAKASAAWLRG